MTPYRLIDVPMDELLPGLEAMAPSLANGDVRPMHRLLAEWCLDLAERACSLHTPESVGWRIPLDTARGALSDQMQTIHVDGNIVRDAYAISAAAGDGAWVLARALAVVRAGLSGGRLLGMSRATWTSFCECMPEDAQTEARALLLSALGAA